MTFLINRPKQASILQKAAVPFRSRRIRHRAKLPSSAIAKAPIPRPVSSNQQVHLPVQSHGRMPRLDSTASVAQKRTNDRFDRRLDHLFQKYTKLELAELVAYFMDEENLRKELQHRLMARETRTIVPEPGARSNGAITAAARPMTVVSSVPPAAGEPSVPQPDIVDLTSLDDNDDEAQEEEVMSCSEGSHEVKKEGDAMQIDDKQPANHTSILVDKQPCAGICEADPLEKGHDGKFPTLKPKAQPDAKEGQDDIQQGDDSSSLDHEQTSVTMKEGSELVDSSYKNVANQTAKNVDLMIARDSQSAVDGAGLKCDEKNKTTADDKKKEEDHPLSVSAENPQDDIDASSSSQDGDVPKATTARNLRPWNFAENQALRVACSIYPPDCRMRWWKIKAWDCKYGNHNFHNRSVEDVQYQAIRLGI